MLAYVETLDPKRYTVLSCRWDNRQGDPPLPVLIWKEGITKPPEQCSGGLVIWRMMTVPAAGAAMDPRLFYPFQNR